MEKLLTGTKEWASWNHNILGGCFNDCLYCYAKCMAIRFKRATPESWKTEVLNQRVMEAGIRKRKSNNVMFPSTHDITPEFIKEHLTVIRKLLDAGNKVLIVSKPRISCIRELCDQLGDYKEAILFRFTIGSADNQKLKFWEPNAPLFEERLESLKYAFQNGYQTSLSIEPMLDERADLVVETVKPFITESIWLGKVNRLISNLTINGYGNNQEVMKKAKELLKLQSNQNIRNLYEKYKNDPIIRWKDSIRKVIGI